MSDISLRPLCRHTRRAGPATRIVEPGASTRSSSIMHYGAGRSHGRAASNAEAVVAEGDEDGEAASPASAAADRRHTGSGPGPVCRGGMCPPSTGVGQGRRPVPPVAAERLPARDGPPVPVPGRYEVHDRMGPQRRLHGLSRPPACGRGPQQGDLQKEPPGGLFTEPSDHGLGRSRGGFSTKLHLAVKQGQKPIDRDHGRAARRLAANVSGRWWRQPPLHVTASHRRARACGRTVSPLLTTLPERRRRRRELRPGANRVCPVDG